jgi:DNA-binding IclR family transcriptional regulator
MKTTQTVLERVRAEYLEMPGMRLTIQQVQRLCGIEPIQCRTVLDGLVEAEFLSVTPDGRYTRSTEGTTLRPRPAKARLGVAGDILKAS